MSLTKCLKRAGTAITPEDKSAVLEFARRFRAEGKKADEAGIMAIEKQLAAVRQMMAEEQNRKPEPVEAPAARPEAVATHKDPGEPAEPVTQAVVTEAITKAAENKDVPRSTMKREALRLIDEAIARAPSTDEIDAQIRVGQPVTRMGKKEISASRTFDDESTVSVEARQTTDGKWKVTDESYDGSGTGAKRRTVLGELAGGPAEARAQLLSLMRRLTSDGKVGQADMVKIKVPGDGTFTILNTREALADFRKKVEKSPGFSDRATVFVAPRVNGYGMRKEAGSAFGVEDGSGGPKAVVENMVDEGDPQAAVDYAAARGLDIAEVLRGDKTRLGKVAGLTPTAEAVGEFEAEAESALAELNRVADEVLGQAVAAAPAQSGTVENFGEALPPARRAMAAKLDEDLSDDDIAKRPFSEIWPAAENDAIEDPFAAAVAHAARAEVPAKPRVAYKLRNWVQKVKTVRELAGMVVSGRVSREVLAEQIQGPRRVLADWWTKVQLLEQIPRDQWKRIGAVEERPEASVMRGGAFVSAPIVRIQVDERSHWLSGDGTLAGSMDQIRALLEAPEPEQRMEFEVRQRRKDGSVFVNKKGDPEYRPLMEFASVEEARAAIKEQYDALVGAWEAVKARDNITERDLRSAENRPRAGKDHRGGRDVTAEQFQQQFGFRGGEFGKWVQQGKGDKERQALLNSAYDALMDLADIVGVEPRAISLNGTLGIAFGSRGTGWASAHFEPSNLVINLTKTRGAGALAHEWFHALDNYFSRLRRGGEEAPFSGDKDQYRRENYITHSPEPLMVKKDGRWPPMTRAKLERLHQLHPSAPAYNPANWEVDPKAPRGVRPEVEARFAALVSVLTDSPMAKRSALISKSSSGYWTQTLELAARAFENYVQARMLEQGYHNDFLANVIAADDVGKSAERYPYLLAGEIPPVADAFAALFAELKTRQGDDGRLALYEPVPEGYTATNASPDAPTARDPGATPAPGGSGAPSAGRAAESEAAADESVRRAGGALPGGARFTALGIARQLDLAGSAALVGRTASTPDQLAELAQVYRNPRYETFRVFFTKGDTIVHATGVSARLPGLTPMAPWGVTTQEYLTQFRDLMQSTGADGYYILHNHPSGDPTPSTADENLTMFLAGQVPGMRAHVVINSNRYAVLSPTGDRRTEIRDFGPDTLLEASIPSAILGRQIGSPQDLVSLGKNLQRPGYVTLIGTSGPESKVRAVIEAPASLLGRSPVYLAALVRRLQRESGSSQMFLVGTSADISSRPVQRALNRGILRDAVADVGRTMAEQGLGGATGGFDKSRGRVQFSRSLPAARVEQDEDGRPVILGQRVEMRFAQPTERLEVIEQPGEEVLHFPIMAAEGFDVLGHAILLVKDGRPTSLIDIEVYGKGEGVGRAAIETLLAAFPDSDLNISNIVPDARGFWEKMGIPQQNVEGAYDGTLNWETYQAAAGDRAGAGEVAADGQGSGAQPFARGEGSGRGQSAPAPRAARGLTAARLGALVDRITANWANRPDIVVVESMQDPLVPEEVRREDQLQRSRGASGEPEGFFYKGKVYLVGAGLRTEADAIRVLFHETLGHAGLRGAFGKELATVLDLIAAGRPADMAEMARLYGKDLSKPGDRRYVAEEVLAMLAQTRPELGLVQRAVAAIRNFLRRLGVQMELSDNDIIANFILPARGWIERGQGRAQGGAAQFSRSGGADIDRAWRDLTNSFKFSDFDTEPATKVTGTMDDFVLSREQGKQWAALNVREMRRDDGRTVYSASLEVGSEGFPAGTGAATTMYLQALNIAQKRGMGWQSDSVRSDNARAIYKRLTEAGVPFKDDGGASYVTAEELAGVDLMAVAEKMADGRPMPAFSRSIPDTLRTAQDLVNTKGGVFDFNRLGETKQDRIRTAVDGSRPFWLGALTRDQIADIYGDQIAEVREYDQLTRAMENERSKIAQDADQIYSDWARLGSEVNDRLSRVMLDATVHSVNPDGEFTTIASNDAETEAERKQVHARLVRQFEALPEEARAMYATVRDFHAGMLDQLRQGLEQRIERQVQEGKARAAALTEIRAAFDRYKEHGPYFPLSRFGDFLVIGTRPDGERVVASYETAGEQQAAARALRGDGFTVKTKTAKDYSRAMDGSAGRFAGDVLTMLDGLDLDDANINGKAADLKSKLLDDVNQLFIRALPDLSYRKHFAHRKNTPGFSSDMMRGFASSAFHAASHIARLNHGDRMSFSLERAFKRIEQSEEGDFNKNSQVLNELALRHDASMNPNVHPIAAMLNQVGFVMYLGASPAAGLVNLLQTPMVTLPYLGARHGFMRASAFMRKATADIMGAKVNRRSGWDAAESPKLTQVERDTIRKLQDEGVIDLTQAHDLSAATGLDTGNVARSKTAFAMARAMRIIGWTFHVPEVMNRQVTALTAYRLEMKASGDQAKAEDAAREAIKRTHFDYSSSNRARYMQGNVARVVMQFKQYAQNMTYLLSRAAYEAMKGETPEVRKIARRQLIGTLAATFSMAGALGLPGLGMVGGLIGVAVEGLDDDDEPWEWKVEFRNLMADTFGKEIGEVISHGLPRALMPWDIAGRVGIGELWFRSNDREGQSSREAFAADMANILGPTAGTLLGFYTASDHMARGNWSKAVESIVPKFIRDPLQSARISSEGVTSYNGEHLMDVTAAESIGRALGFTPARVSEMYEGRNAVQNAKLAVEGRRQVLVTRAAQARIERDVDAQREVAEEIAEFNRRNPQERITGETISRSVINRMRRKQQMEDGVSLPANRERFRDEGRFASVE